MGPARTAVEGLVAEATRVVLAALADAGVPARFGPPVDGSAAGEGNGTLHVWPLTLAPDAITAPGPDALRLRVHLLLASDGSAGSLGLIDRALLVATADPRLGLILDPLPAQTWTALGVRPRVAVLVEVPAHLPRRSRLRTRVRGPLRLQDAPMGTLRGRVVGPGAVPIPGAVVQVVDIEISTRTDRDGSFALAGVPAAEPVQVLVSARGAQLSAQVVADAPQPAVLTLDLGEDL